MPQKIAKEIARMTARRLPGSRSRLGPRAEMAVPHSYRGAAEQRVDEPADNGDRLVQSASGVEERAACLRGIPLLPEASIWHVELVREREFPSLEILSELRATAPRQKLMYW